MRLTDAVVRLVRLTPRVVRAALRWRRQPPDVTPAWYGKQAMGPVVVRYATADETLPARAKHKRDALARIDRARARVSSQPVRDTGGHTVMPFPRKVSS